MPQCKELIIKGEHDKTSFKQANKYALQHVVSIFARFTVQYTETAHAVD